MKICGIVAEYNPFHNGHKYQIEQTKKLTNCDTVIAIMSGNFIQRGLPALFDKWTRAKMAIENGVDVVIELPTCYATSSAEFFAHGAIGIMDALNCVDVLSFGSKYNDIEVLKRIANVLHSEPEEYKKLLQKELKKGTSFPIARSNALKNFLKKEFDSKLLENILLDSNNILGIEYLKALLTYDSPISPCAIERIGGDYNSTNIVGNICSATGIREMLQSNNIDRLPDVIPEKSLEILINELKLGKVPMQMKNFEKEILLLLRKLSADELSEISDITEGLENVLKKSINEAFEIDDLIERIKTKRYTKTRVQRILIHTLLGIKKSMLQEQKETPQYARVLALSKNGKKILPELVKNSRIPIVTSVSKFIKKATDYQKEMLELDILATNVYTLGYEVPNFKKINIDYTVPIQEEKKESILSLKI